MAEQRVKQVLACMALDLAHSQLLPLPAEAAKDKQIYFLFDGHLHELHARRQALALLPAVPLHWHTGIIRDILQSRDGS